MTYYEFVWLKMMEWPPCWEWLRNSEDAREACRCLMMLASLQA